MNSNDQHGVAHAIEILSIYPNRLFDTVEMCAVFEKSKAWAERAFKTKAKLVEAVLELDKNRDIYVGCGRFEARGRKGAGAQGHGVFNTVVRIDLDAGEGKNGAMRDYNDKIRQGRCLQRQLVEVICLTAILLILVWVSTLTGESN